MNLRKCYEEIRRTKRLRKTRFSKISYGKRRKFVRKSYEVVTSGGYFGRRYQDSTTILRKFVRVFCCFLFVVRFITQIEFNPFRGLSWFWRHVSQSTKTDDATCRMVHYAWVLKSVLNCLESRKVCVQNCTKLSAAVHELSCWQRKTRNLS